MGTINIGDIRVEMVVATDVKNVNGQLLMPKGLKITEKHISLLQAWGVTEVEIEGVSREEVAQETAARLDPQALAEAEAFMAETFLHANLQHPALKELHDQCVLRLARMKMQTPR